MRGPIGLRIPGHGGDEMSQLEDAQRHAEYQIAKLEDELDMARQMIERMHEVLDECEDYFEQRSDADHTGVTYIANQEMKLLMMIRRMRGIE
jgi:hypothetical protein